MASFNKVTLLGNVTRDIELRYVGANNTACAEIGLATNRSWTDKATGERKEEVTFVDVTVFGRTAEIAAQFLGRGKPALIHGRIKQETWSDKETGQNRSKLKVVCEELVLLGGGKGSDEGGGEKKPSKPAKSNKKPQESFVNESADEDIPF